jgi:phosphoenolpyruvate carboxykinase (ATP)
VQWANKNLYNETLEKLASLFQKKFKLYADYTVGNDLKLMEEILAAGPQLTQDI